MLGAAGYQTALIGKWHRGTIGPEYLPHRRGFDLDYGVLGGQPTYTPLEAPEELLAKYASIEDRDRRIFTAMVDAMDTAIGRVVGALQEEGIAENILIIWVSDNGGQTNMNAGGNNEPLREQKGSAYDGVCGFRRCKELRGGEAVKRGPVVLGAGNNSAVFSGEYKFVEQTIGQTTVPSLFRIFEDPNEERDVKEQYPEMAAELLAILRAHPRGTADKVA